MSKKKSKKEGFNLRHVLPLIILVALMLVAVAISKDFAITGKATFTTPVINDTVNETVENTTEETVVNETEDLTENITETIPVETPIEENITEPDTEP
ncbi:hypothetical protein KY337_05150, partial [Candidatus Woesearchaeota archaeon]|nr:hypothetical protein [Candidatus Woesearchaeota archaeon]